MVDSESKPDVVIDERSLAEIKYKSLHGTWRWITIAISAIVILLTINQVFQLGFFVNKAFFELSYFFVIASLLLSLAFLNVPSVKDGLKGIMGRISNRLDYALFFLVLGVGFYFAWNAVDIISEGWVYRGIPPLPALIMAAILWVLIIEGVRRATGNIIALVILFVSLYPLFAEYMPGILQGLHYSFASTIQFHILGIDSTMGALMRVFCTIILGFTLFAVAVLATGGGKFFLDLALSIVGTSKGGTGKVAVLASAMFGSVSGSSIVNVITTGSVTIPAMKKAGFKPHYAGAIECCASTAGTFTPPIMGGAAFVMASFLNISYAEVALAAAVPAILFYVGLYTQIGGYVVKQNLQGLKKEDCPSFWKTIKRGWFYFPAAAVLIYYLFILKFTGEAPYVATAVLLILAQIQKESRFTWSKFLTFIENAGQNIMELLVIILGVSMLLGSFGLTGLGVTFARELLNIAGGNLVFMLPLCALASLIMGTGMTLLAVYIFLSIVIAPALILAGISPLPAHLFILYTGMLSYLTPPVALCAFPAATIAQTSPMKVGITAVRLGGAIFLLPFFFVLDPGLILRGGIGGILIAVTTCGLGIFLIASALEGYLSGIGRLWWSAKSNSYLLYGYFLRVVTIISGILLGLPWWQAKILGLAIATIILLPKFINTRNRRSTPISP